MKQGIFDWMTAHSDLLSESIPGVPLVELIGDNRVLIEYHAGVTKYSDTEIMVSTSHGAICIQGSSLALTKMSKSQLVIHGHIKSICLIRGGAK